VRRDRLSSERVCFFEPKPADWRCSAPAGLLAYSCHNQIALAPNLREGRPKGTGAAVPLVCHRGKPWRSLLPRLYESGQRRSPFHRRAHDY
jgi:hypothetical protein